MNRFAKVAAIGIMSVTSFAGASFAMSAASSNELDLSNTTPKFDVQAVDALQKSDAAYGRYDNLTPTSPGVHALQASILSNKTLTGDLKAQNVEIDNIVGAVRADDGSVTFYVR